VLPTPVNTEHVKMEYSVTIVGVILGILE